MFGLGRDQRIAEALEAAVAKIRRMQADHAQQMATLIDEDNSAAAMNRKLRSATNAVNLEALIVDEAHRNARRLVAMHAAGQPTGRRGPHGLTPDKWAWAYAALRHAGVRSAGGGWQVTDLDEAVQRINQSLNDCRRYGLDALRKYNQRNQVDQRRRPTGKWYGRG